MSLRLFRKPKPATKSVEQSKNKIELDPRLQKLLNDEKKVKFTQHIQNDHCDWYLINFEKNNYTAQFSHRNYITPLKLSQAKDHELSFTGRYLRKFLHSYYYTYNGEELPKDDDEYVYIKLDIKMYEYNGYELYYLVESIGFKEDLKPMFTFYKCI